MFRVVDEDSRTLYTFVTGTVDATVGGRCLCRYYSRRWRQRVPIHDEGTSTTDGRTARCHEYPSARAHICRLCYHTTEFELLSPSVICKRLDALRLRYKPPVTELDVSHLCRLTHVCNPIAKQKLLLGTTGESFSRGSGSHSGRRPQLSLGVVVGGVCRLGSLALHDLSLRERLERMG